MCPVGSELFREDGQDEANSQSHFATWLSLLKTFHLCVLCGSQNGEYLLYTALNDWFL